jgi:hypothetical protein
MTAKWAWTCAHSTTSIPRRCRKTPLRFTQFPFQQK